MRRFGLALPFAAPTQFTAEFAVEAPVQVAATVDTARPCRIGAFTSVAGGRLRHVASGATARWPAACNRLEEAPDTWATTSPLAREPDLHGWATLLGHDPRDPRARCTPAPGHHDRPRRPIGEGAFLRPGITVGDGAAIAPRAVVLEEIPPSRWWKARRPARCACASTRRRWHACAPWPGGASACSSFRPTCRATRPRLLDHLEQAIAAAPSSPTEPGGTAPAAHAVHLIESPG